MSYFDDVALSNSQKDILEMLVDTPAPYILAHLTLVVHTHAILPLNHLAADALFLAYVESFFFYYPGKALACHCISRLFPVTGRFESTCPVNSRSSLV